MQPSGDLSSRVAAAWETPVSALSAADERERDLQTLLLRREGENTLLQLQVQQLKAQNTKVGEHVQGLASQLTQVLQILDQGRSTKASQARQVVVNVQRALQRLSSGELANAGNVEASTSRLQTSTAERIPRTSGLQADRVSDRPNSQRTAVDHPRGETPGGDLQSDDAAPPLTDRSSRQAHQQQQAVADRRAARLAKESYEKERTRRIEAESKAKAALEAEEKRYRLLQAERDGAFNEVAGLKFEVQELRAMLDVQQVPEVNGTGLGSKCASSNGLDDIVGSAANQAVNQALANELQSLRQQFDRQRGMLCHLLRRRALIEDEKATLRDDVTRRNVQIHNLKQEKEQQSQALQQQYHQFQQQQKQQQQEQAQIQQLHQMQQNQQLQQLQKLQCLLQAQQQLQQQQQRQHLPPEHHADAHVQSGQVAPMPAPQGLRIEPTHYHAIEQLIEAASRGDPSLIRTLDPSIV